MKIVASLVLLSAIALAAPSGDYSAGLPSAGPKNGQQNLPGAPGQGDNGASPVYGNGVNSDYKAKSNDVYKTNGSGNNGNGDDNDSDDDDDDDNDHKGGKGSGYNANGGNDGDYDSDHEGDNKGHCKNGHGKGCDGAAGGYSANPAPAPTPTAEPSNPGQYSGVPAPPPATVAEPYVSAPTTSHSPTPTGNPAPVPPGSGYSAAPAM